MRTSLAVTRNSFTTAIQGEVFDCAAANLPASLYDEAIIKPVSSFGETQAPAVSSPTKGVM